MAQTKQVHIENNTLIFGDPSFSKSTELEGHLAAFAFESLARDPSREIITDYSGKGKQPIKAGMLLALAYLLSSKLKRLYPDQEHIGIVLPPGIGAFIANLAVTLADKTPVNINFTVSPSAIAVSILKANIHVIISSPVLREKLPNFPWTETFFDLSKQLKKLSKVKILAFLTSLSVFSSKNLIKWLKVPTVGGDKKAAIIFTSGSSGTPKGAILTHRNILGNIFQILSLSLITPKDKILACLPIFHSFGFTVTLWYPLISGTLVTTVPNPLETRKIADVIEAEKATLLLGTPTFLQPHLKKTDPAKIASLKAVIAGAEKTPPAFKKAWEAQFNSRYLEGYGLTETSPVVSVNLPYVFNNNVLHKPGSVGIPLIGHEARIVDPETEEVLPPNKSGILELCGPNIFAGYLNDPEETNKVFRGKWFHTKDIAHFDNEGFLFIQGRTARFSKIGGEMVPHITVEHHILEAFDIHATQKMPIAVTSREHASRGEILVLLVTIEISQQELISKLQAFGIPNLWIPKEIVSVDEIPCLPSGKIDLCACQKIASIRHTNTTA